MQKIEFELKLLDGLHDEVLVTSLAMVCPFSSAEKQGLLEAQTLVHRAEFLLDLLTINLNNNSEKRITMNITDILSSIKNKRIMVVGDAMLDCYIEGAVMRISPEAPVPIMKNAKTTKLAGGSANVARNITSLSGVADLVAVIGADDYGHDLCRLLAEDNALNAHFFTDNLRPTTTKIRHVAQGQHLLRSDIEDNSDFSDKHYAALLKTVEKLASSLPIARFYPIMIREF